MKKLMRSFLIIMLVNKMELTDEESWIIVENLMVSYSELEELQNTESEKSDDYKVAKILVGNVLDKLSPNWRDSDACMDVKTNKIIVGE